MKYAPIELLKSVFIAFTDLLLVRNKSQEEIKQFHLAKLKKLINFAWENIPFYHEYWQAHGFSPSHFQTLEDMHKIPCIDKEIVRKHYEQMVPTGYDKNRLKKVTSGGTTGMPLSFYINYAVAHGCELVYQPYRYWRTCRYLLGVHRVVILRGEQLPEELTRQGIYWRKSKGIRGRGLLMSIFHLTEENYELYLKQIRDCAPRFIVAYPSALTALCTLMKKHRTPPLIGLRGVICSSEMVYDSQRKLVKDALGVEIYSFYGHSEKTVSAIPDEQHRMLFEPMYGYCEFLKSDGKIEDQNGETAEIISTGYHNLYMPLIRYRTSDYVVVGDNPPLGYLHVGTEIIGRAQDFVYDVQGNQMPFICADEVFWDIDGLIAYQYHQTQKGHLKILIEVNDEFHTSEMETIRKSAQQQFPVCQIEVVIVSAIERTAAGKFRYFVQQIK